MKSLRSAVVRTFAALSFGLPLAHGAGFNLFSATWGDVIVATDTTPEGRKLTPPAPAEPVYYLGQSLGCRLGSIPGDRLPPPKEMNRFVADVLAKQGYLGATPGVHEPTLYLVVQWGQLDPRSGDHLWFLGYDARQDIAAPIFPGMLGAEVWRRNSRSRMTETILDYASGPIYGIIITAFDYQSANTPKPVIYWQTRIALPTNGKSMAEALPAMVLAAGPSIGRESDRPLLRDVDNARKGRVDLGQLKVIGLADEPVAPNPLLPAAPQPESPE
jgi:hypothetical protein